ncbi:MAG: serine hydrolase domain-containing protein [Chloroflexia bacterium]
MHPETQPSVEERIRRVEANLLLDPKPWQPAAEPTLPERMRYHNVPGLSVAVINEGRIEWARAYGVLEAGKPEPVEAGTLFQAGSISKAVTAAAALRLVGRGLLALDEDVNRFLTSWRVPPNDGWQPRVTLRQLLSHTAGTTVHGFPGYPRDGEVPTLLQVLEGRPPANTPPVRVSALPGTQWRYSGGGTTIVQQLLIDVTGQSFPDLMRELVLEPAGMESSTFEQLLPERLWASATTGHYWVKNDPVRGKWHVYPEMAAAGLWTTATDLARFALAIQSSRAASPSALLSPEITAQMLSPHVDPDRGLGLFLSGSGDTFRFGHSGQDHGFEATLDAYSERGLGAAIMTNAYAGERLYQELRAAIAREYAWPGFLPPEHEAIPLDPTAFGPFMGEYEPGLAGGESLPWIVAREGDALTLQVPGQDPVAPYPKSETAFFIEAVDASISFERGESGRITRLVFHQNDSTITATRLEQ